MAILDAFTRVSSAQDLTTGALSGLILSTDVVDLTASGVTRQFRDIGRGNELSLRFQVDEAFTAGGGGATALDVLAIVNDDSTSSILALSNLVNLSKWSNLLTLLTAGAIFTLPIPTIPAHMLSPSLSRSGRHYLSVLYTLTGGDLSLTTGKITADFGFWRDTAVPSFHKSGFAGP